MVIGAVLPSVVMFHTIHDARTASSTLYLGLAPQTSQLSTGSICSESLKEPGSRNLSQYLF